MPSGLAACLHDLRGGLLIETPAAISNVVVKPFGTLDLAISALALARSVLNPGDFAS